MGQPEPDPGNAPPEQWSEDFDEETRNAVFARVNDVAVTLPEPEGRED